MDKDERFKHISTDPKFRHIPKGVKKVKIDKRFHGMFKDEKFKVKYTVDKRGRPVNHTSNDDLKRYYDMSSDSDESDEESDELNESGKFVRAPKVDTTVELEETNKDDKVLSNDIKKKLKDLSVDYARGEGCLNSDSSSDEEEYEEQSDESDIEHGWGEMDRDAETTEESTKRLAVCNMDWDRIRAVDLMVLFSSFLPAGSHIESIAIYPSEFGLKRMKEEDIKGPTELVENKEKYNKDDENEEGSKYHMEKLRQYQLNRLKYYYAVIVSDSIETANKLYTECDGLEYESSATIIDLRFIPDDTTFDHPPKEICNKLPEMSRYQPRFFTTTALQQAKVELTWDETNPNRLEIAKKFSDGKVDDVSEADLQAYLASSSGEESEDKAYSSNDQNEKSDANPIDKYRALLNDLEKTNEEKGKKDVEMEVTWELNVKNDTEKMVKKKIAENEEKTPFQQYLDKRKDKRKTKREERKKQHDTKDIDDSESDHDVDMNDPYFAEEFNNPEFKKKKNKKKEQDDEKEETNQEKAELELLLLDNEDEKGHFNFKKIEKEENSSKKKKRKNKNKPKGEETESVNDDFQVDVKDARFSAIFTSHHYNIDPTDARYRKTKAMEALVEEKQKRIGHDDETSKASPPKKKQKHAELNALVNSVKRKTKDLIKKK